MTSVLLTDQITLKSCFDIKYCSIVLLAATDIDLTNS